METLTIQDLSDLNLAANKILHFIAGKRIICFYGEMGAGKTTLIKAICEELGVIDNVVSPTFALINEYKDKTGRKIYHFDFYRINRVEEVYDFGYEEYFYNSVGICLIEWPELIEALLPQENICRLRITVNSDQSRYVAVE
jgi:tRNA threonylcarbamoyladenosine biosynthesis protein TsaE